jgi:hypothetical protein
MSRFDPDIHSVKIFSYSKFNLIGRYSNRIV